MHQGQVKQIIGDTLSDQNDQTVENFVSKHDAGWFASKYRRDGLVGGHVIKLGDGNDEAAKLALSSYPGGLQIGGGIDGRNAAQWLDAGASHVIVTSWLFDKFGHFQSDRLSQLVSKIGRRRIVVDLSCKQTADGWVVAMNRWQTLTDLPVCFKTLDSLADHCAEFLIHAADVEGRCCGIDHDLVELMGNWGKIPMTYAGGIAAMSDVESIATIGNNRVDFTVGSSLDLFGGDGVRYDELLDWNRRAK